MLRERSGAPLPLGAPAAIANIMATTHTQVNEASFAVAWAEGRAMTLEQVVTYALEEEAA
jgi:hypothetical protein